MLPTIAEDVDMDELEAALGAKGLGKAGWGERVKKIYHKVYMQ